MAGSDQDIAAKLIERLLTDPTFRVRFRRDPANACREAGLEDLAQEMSLGAGNAMMTLDLRQSKSSLAGVMMAAAMEGVGVMEFAQHVAPVIGDIGGSVGDVLSRVNLPAVSLPGRGALSGGGGGGGAPATPVNKEAGGLAGGGGAANGAGGGGAAVADPSAPVSAEPAPGVKPAGGTEAGAPAGADPDAPAKADDPAAAAAKEIADADKPLTAEEQAKAAADQIAADQKPDLPEKTDLPEAGALNKLPGEEAAGAPAAAPAAAQDVAPVAAPPAEAPAGAPAGTDEASFMGPAPAADPAAAAPAAAPPAAAAPAAAPPATAGAPVVGVDPNAAAAAGAPPAAAVPGAAVPGAPVAGAPAAPGAPVAAIDPNAAAGAPPAEVSDSGTFMAVDPSSQGRTSGAGGTISESGTFMAVRPVVGPPSAIAPDPANVPGAVVDLAANTSAGSSDLGARALVTAHTQLGVQEHGTNTGAEVDKYLAAAGVPPGNPWCASFVTWALEQNGHKMEGGGWGGVATWVENARQGKNDLSFVDPSEARPGDLVVYDWGGQEDFGADGHIGFLASKVEGDQFTALEGNNGDAVQEVPRHLGGANVKFIRVGDGGAPPQVPGAPVIDPQTGAPVTDPQGGRSAVAAADLAGAGAGAGAYPGDHAPKEQIAAWMAAEAKKRGLPPELPIMASLVESNMSNLDYGDASSLGYFQMLQTIWDKGEYKGYADKPELQIKWFLDTAERVKDQRLAAGKSITDPKQFGEWIADTERPAAQYRGRYQLRLDEAQGLLAKAAAHPAAGAGQVVDQAAGRSAVGAPVDQTGAPSSSPPPDPDFYGQEGTGGPVTGEIQALLDNPKVKFDETGLADLKAGKIDPRVVAALTKIGQDHDITVTCMCSDHPKFSSSGNVSNHAYGRGVDIGTIDGELVRAGSPAARELASAMMELDPDYRPNEIGSPFAIAGPGYFTDAAHQDHLHLGFKEPIDPSWTPPADVAAPGGAATAAPGAPVVAGVQPNAAGIAPGAPPVAAGDSGSFMAVDPSQEARSATAGAGGAANESGTFMAVQPVVGPPAAIAPDPSTVPAAVVSASANAAVGSSPLGAKALEIAHTQIGVHEEGVNSGAKVNEYLAAAGVPPGNAWCASFVTWSLEQSGHKMDGGGWAGVATWVQNAREGKNNLSFVDPADARPGDLVVYDWGGQEDFGADGHIGFLASNVEGDQFTALEGNNGDQVQEVPRHLGGGANVKFIRVGDGGAPPAAGAPAPTAGSVADPQPTAAGVTDQPGGARVDLSAVDGAYPGDHASKDQIAAWMAKEAEKRGLPPQLPIMASLVESNMSNLDYGDASSLGYFQMLQTIWDKGEYKGYADKPELQIKWFLDTAERVKDQRLAAGKSITDPNEFGEWIADTERPAAQYRGRYQLRLDEANQLLSKAGATPVEGAPVAPAPVAAVPAPEATAAAAPPDPAAPTAEAAEAKAAAAKSTSDSGSFMAVDPAERSDAGGSGGSGGSGATVQFMQAIDPNAAAPPAAALPVDPAAAAPAPAASFTEPPAAAAASADGRSALTPDAPGGAAEVVEATGDYPGDGATKQELAKWLAKKAEEAGLPPELPVMASLVESGVRNINYGDADSVGFFQMRVGIWNKGEYAGFPENPDLQAKWFIDNALQVKKARLAAGKSIDDPSQFGEWIADVERPAEQYRGRYQLRLAEARNLLKG